MDAKAELHRRLCALLPDGGAPLDAILADYTVRPADALTESDLGRWIGAFLAAKRIDGLSPKTLHDYKGVLGAFARSMDKPLQAVDVHDVRGYLGYLAGERGLKDSSIQTHANTLRSFFTWLTTEEALPRNPMCKIRSRRLDMLSSRRPLAAEGLERLRDHCQSYREKALIEFLVSTGCRLSELVGVRTAQIDWQERSVRVLGKGGRERIVYFSVRAKLMLRAYLDSRPGGEALFANARAPYGPMQSRSVQRALRQIGDRAGMRLHPHLLRHTFASNALNGGMDLTVIQQLMGHTDPKTTLIYAKLSPHIVRYAYEKVMA